MEILFYEAQPRVRSLLLSDVSFSQQAWAFSKATGSQVSKRKQAGTGYATQSFVGSSGDDVWTVVAWL